ncbi:MULTISPECIES: recombination mediator RecR [Dehalobacter]|jgi:recombination protein RecR|uniref:Recombination protein RecR n=2 Tax=Dehalobacter restrictus TaxID=55583 RepID=A0A857DEM9_9FIRM|nr:MULTISPECIES: recombination mediator RecR [Dehalobacter]AFV01233.1 Recombination protein RecR [Dehalobacter sp. DCA]AFV04273.1 Recombination protein RecR [Dehalobacter sp. CF]AHF08819.1 recombinase RecR [Dehalobacter restrictus DSM 9455]EQB20189.1 Recombination protein RecR [Dehalobacter sp. UNSWDHB]MCG1024162.1 recombination mediator RecR [Dehalobacter sp.]
MDYLYYPQPVSDLIAAFSRLPGVGPKTAGRLAFYLLRHPDQAGELTQAVTKALQDIKQCTVCGNYTDIDPCKICSGERRDRTLLCVVEQPRDVIALEKTGEYKGLYHVLHGVLSPMEGIGPEQLNLSPLFHRLEGVQEVVLAVNPTVEGEATSLYISKLLKPIEIKVTKIAHGLPVGGDLEYADEVTIARALEGRRQL